MLSWSLWEFEKSIPRNVCIFPHIFSILLTHFPRNRIWIFRITLLKEWNILEKIYIDFIVIIRVILGKHCVSSLGEIYRCCFHLLRIQLLLYPVWGKYVSVLGQDLSLSTSSIGRFIMPMLFSDIGTFIKKLIHCPKEK